MNDTTFLEKILSEWKVEVTEVKLRQFVSFYELLVEKNKVMNLTGITEWDEVVMKHFLDSCALGNVMDLNQELKVLDLGTGAGFPGMPLKIAFPKLDMYLVDALRKRVDFLDEVIVRNDMEGVCSIHSRAEEFGQDPEMRESFDLCVSRAVSRLNVLSEWCLPNLKVGGKFVAYKSGVIEKEVEEAKFAIKTLGGEISDILKFSLPNGEIDRSFVVISKVENTPSKYPRRPGIPEKKPLLG